MLVYQPKAWAHLLPVRDHLVRDGHTVVLVSPREATDRPLEAAGLPFIKAHERLPSPRFAMNLLRSLHRMKIDESDAMLRPLVATGGPLRKMLAWRALYYSTVYAGLARKAAVLEELDGVIGTDSGSVAGRFFFRSALTSGKPAVLLQHGLFAANAGVREYFVGQRIFVWGSTSFEQLERHVSSASAFVEILGSPLLEQRLTETTSAAESDGRTIVAVAFGVPGGFMSVGAFMAAAREVLLAAGRLSDFGFVIKPHPGDSTTIWHDLIEETGVTNVTVVRNRDIYSLLRTSQALITMVSTTGAEASCLGLPVFSVDFSGANRSADFVQSGAAYVVEREGELADRLRSVLTSPGRDELFAVRAAFAGRFLHREDESASKRVARRLVELTQSAGQVSLR